MQLRVSNSHAHSPFTNAVPAHLRRKPQPIFTYHTAPQNVYYDNNPYLLRVSPSQPRVRGAVLARTRNDHSREPSDHSSHRSLKVVRVNGLREAEKPRVIRIQDQQSLRSSRAQEQRRREGELQGENRVLREENEALRERVRQLQEGKEREMGVLHEKIAQLMKLTQDLQDKMERAEEQWRTEVKKLQQSTYQ